MPAHARSSHPKDAQSPLQLLAIARCVSVFRLDRTPFERAARSRPKSSQALRQAHPNGLDSGQPSKIGALILGSFDLSGNGHWLTLPRSAVDR